MKKILITIVGILLLAIVVLPFVVGNAEVDELNDETRSHLEGEFIQLSDGFVHYELKGSSESQVVILIHGNAAPYFSWDRNVEALVGAGFRVLRYDIYGHGFSDRPSVTYNRDLYDRQLVELLNALGIQEPVDIVGTSQGGSIAASFTARHPEKVRKLALLAPLVDTFEGAGMVKFMATPGIGEYIFKVLGDTLNLQSINNKFASPEKIPEFREKFERQLQFKGFKRARLSNMRNDGIEDNTDSYRIVGQQGRPVLLIWGTNDRSISAGSMSKARELIPTIVYREITGAGHVAHYERPEEVNPILIEFLKE